ncbi:hypothetical protein D3C87_1700650 [compost metagenome]
MGNRAAERAPWPSRANTFHPLPLGDSDTVAAGVERHSGKSVSRMPGSAKGYRKNVRRSFRE